MHAIDVWRRALPDVALEHPGTWAVLGRLADQRAQPRGALRCYLEAIRRDPNHRQATYQLSLLFKRFGDGDHAEHFGRRAAWLAEVDAVVELVNGNKQDLRLVHQAAALYEQLGRDWEALGGTVWPDPASPEEIRCGWPSPACSPRLSQRRPRPSLG